MNRPATCSRCRRKPSFELDGSHFCDYHFRIAKRRMKLRSFLSSVETFERIQRELLSLGEKMNDLHEASPEVRRYTAYRKAYEARMNNDYGHYGLSGLRLAMEGTKVRTEVEDLLNSVEDFEKLESSFNSLNEPKTLKDCFGDKDETD